MARTISYRTLVLGLLSPWLAAQLGRRVFRALTRMTEDPDSDFAYRLGATCLAMALPFAATLASALLDRRRGAFRWPSGVGLGVATLSLALLWVPISNGLKRARQLENLERTGEPAPDLRAVDLDGAEHRLSDHAGSVVLVNIWATWCGPCRREMPELDRLYGERRADGLVVFGISSEEPDVQRKFLERVPVSYPLLTVGDGVPEIFRTSMRYPANFLVDRRGLLQRAPSTDQPFADLEAAVATLLAAPRPDAQPSTAN